MPYKKHITLSLTMLLLALPMLLLAQKKVTLSGYIRDASSGEAMISATVFVKELAIGTETNTYGFYSISVPAGTYTVIYSYVGFATRTESLTLSDSKKLDIDMQNMSVMKEVEITSTRRDENVKGTQMGTISISAEKIKTLPVIFGETDIL